MKSSLHEDEKQQLLSLLHQLRIGEIDQRMALAEAFFNSEEHHTADGWRKYMQRRGLGFDFDFVSQSLELLTRFGMAYKREFENEPARYEHHHLGDHHDHMICTSCGNITEFMNPDLERLQEKAASDHGFRPLRHRLQIYGLCKDCLASRPSLQPLSEIASGERVRVEKLPRGERASRRLESMGVNKGAELYVLSAGNGPTVVAVKGTRLALGRGESAKIKVSVIS